jgi:uncharacterized membrane protein YfcA
MRMSLSATSALSVATNAFANLIGHWRAGNVKWSCAATFAVAGIVGAAVGSTLGKLVDGQELLFLFALAMIAVGVAMLRPRTAGGNLNVCIAARLIAVGLVVGAISGFFGIGGGFLIVPGLMLGSGMLGHAGRAYRRMRCAEHVTIPREVPLGR